LAERSPDLGLDRNGQFHSFDVNASRRRSHELEQIRQYIREQDDANGAGGQF